MTKKKNKWFVITGGPCSGKTTTLQRLEKEGYRVIYEAARDIIDEEMKKGRTLQEMRKDEFAFQKKVLKRKIETEQRLPRSELIFLDRGIPDSTAYYELCGVTHDPELILAVKNCSYAKIFLMDLLEYEKDYARTESIEEVKRIQELLEKSYQQFHLIKVPPMSVVDRVEFILERI